MWGDGFDDTLERQRIRKNKLVEGVQYRLDTKIGDRLECKHMYSFITNWRAEDCILPGDKGVIIDIKGNWYVIKLDRKTMLGITDLYILASKIGLYFINKGAKR